MTTGDALNAVEVTPTSVDLFGTHNYRVGAWASNFGTGVGYVMLANRSSPATALLSGGIGLASSNGSLELNATSIGFTPYSTSPGILQQTPASGNGATMTFSAQNAGPGNSNGGTLFFTAGQPTGTGTPGFMEWLAGDLLTGFELIPQNAGPNIAFLNSTPNPMIGQVGPTSGSGGSLTVRAQGGGPGATFGGNLILQGGVQGSSAGTNNQGGVVVGPVDQSNLLLVGTEKFSLGGSATPIIAREGQLGVINAVSYLPSLDSTSVPGTQLGSALRHVAECHFVALTTDNAGCSFVLPMQVHGLMSTEFTTQCRITGAGGGTAVGDVETVHTHADWNNLSSGTGAPSLVGTGNYGTFTNSNIAGGIGTILYVLSGTTLAGEGVATVTYTISSTTGLSLGTGDCTTWTVENYN
jgi:hypothetical protein